MRERNLIFFIFDREMENYRGFWLEWVNGNCFFWSQEEWKTVKLWVAPLVEKWISELNLWEEPVFCERWTNGTLEYFYGLKEFLTFEFLGVPIYIFDNHNHALYFWYKEYFQNRFAKGVKLIHIDQHSDMKPNEEKIDEKNLDSVFWFVQEQCNVGNFIIPALGSGLLGSVGQLRSEYWLLHYHKPDEDYILDIDMDFWEKLMGIEDKEWTFEQTRKLICWAKMVTIATSPFFLDQKEAIKLIQELFKGMKGKSEA